MAYNAFSSLENYSEHELQQIQEYGKRVCDAKSIEAVKWSKDSTQTQDSMIFLLSQIAAIDPVLYKRLYVDITFQEFVPITQYDEGAGEWVYFSLDGTTLGKFVSGNGTNLPTVGLEGAKHRIPFHTAGIQVSYNREEMRQLALIGRSIAQEKIEIALRGCMEHMQTVAYTADRDWET